MSEWNDLNVDTGKIAHNVDARQVAVAFYLSTLQRCVSRQDILFRAVYNDVGADFPECVGTRSLVDAAIELEQKGFEKYKSGPMTDKERRDMSAMLYQYLATLFFTKLREARIFQFRDRDYHTLYHLADVHIELAAGFKWEPFDKDKHVPVKNAARLAKHTVETGILVPFPAKLPFRNCYFAWGTGARVPEVQTRMYGLDEQAFHVVMGTLLCADGWTFTIVCRGDKDSVGFAVGRDGSLVGGMRHLVVLERIGDAPEGTSTHLHLDGTPRAPGERTQVFNPGWVLPFALTPWMVAYAVESIDRNDSLTKVQPGLVKERMQFQALSKRSRQRFLPAPYYTVLIQPTTYEEIEQRIKSQPRDWSHRWDVRGHYGHKIARGTLPLDPNLLLKLRKRGYEIFHALNHPSSEALAFLMRRRVAPPREGEWLAYLRFRREAFIKGPAEKPYVPSVHRLTKGVPEVV